MIKEPSYDKLIKKLKHNDNLCCLIKYLENNILRYDEKNNELIFSTYGLKESPITFNLNLDDEIIYNINTKDPYTHWYIHDYGQKSLEYYEDRKFTPDVAKLVTHILNDVFDSKIIENKNDLAYNIKNYKNNKDFTKHNSIQSFLFSFCNENHIQLYKTVKDEFKYVNPSDFPYMDLADYHLIIPNSITKFLPELQDIDINITNNTVSGTPIEWINANKYNRWGEERITGCLVNSIVASIRRGQLLEHQYIRQQKTIKKIKQYILWNMYYDIQRTK